MLINPVPIWYVDNFQNSNSVLSLMFFHTELKEFNNYLISPDIQSSSDHVPLSIFIIIKEEFIQEKKQSIVRNSNKEKEFVDELRNRIGSIEMTNITNYEMFEYVTQEFATIIEKLEQIFKIG